MKVPLLDVVVSEPMPLELVVLGLVVLEEELPPFIIHRNVLIMIMGSTMAIVSLVAFPIILRGSEAAYRPILNGVNFRLILRTTGFLFGPLEAASL